MILLRSRRLAAVPLLALAVGVAPALSSPAAAAGPAVSPSSDPVAAAAAFLAGTVTGGQTATAGPGATADAVSALVAAGTGRDQVPAMLDYLRGQAADYAKTGEQTRPGQAGKLLLAAGATGASGTDFGGVDLVAGLQARQQDNGYFASPDTGPFAQSVFNHDLATLGLAGVATPTATIGKAARFVATQACSDGSINSGAPLTAACTDAGADGTALAVLALQAGARNGGVPASEVKPTVDKAMDYLAGARQPGGAYGFGGNPSANSTGLVLMAELATGRDGQRTRNALQALRYDCTSSETTLRGAYQGFDDSLSSAILATNQALVPAAGSFYPVAPRSPASLTEAGTVDCNIPAKASRYVGLDSPKRVLDTRTGTGAPRGVTRELTLDLSEDVPAATATAVVLNVTVTNPSARSFVVVYPDGSEQPGTSNLNVEPGQTQANVVTATLPASGKLTLKVDGGTAHLVADLAGYYTGADQAGAGRVTPSSPTRLLDTRTTSSPRRTGEVELDLTGKVPSGSSSVFLNVTATGATNNGFVTAYPAGTSDPGTSNVNFRRAATQANEVVTRIGTGSSAGKVTLRVDGNAALVVDLVATVGPSASTGSLAYVPLSTPTRFLDSRIGLGTNSRARISGTTRVALGDAVPAGARAVVVNLTATNGTRPGFVTVLASGSGDAGTSSVNFPTSLTQANEVVTTVGSDGALSLTVGGSGAPAAHLIGDVVGYLVG